jgi:hypothetical protein
MSLVFKPVGILGGLLAGIVSKKLVTLIWGLIDDQDPPLAKHRSIHLGKLAAALVIEGAVVRLVRGFVDHGTRHGFANLTGEWPGPESPEEEEES